MSVWSEKQAFNPLGAISHVLEKLSLKQRQEVLLTGGEGDEAGFRGGFLEEGFSNWVAAPGPAQLTVPFLRGAALWRGPGRPRNGAVRHGGCAARVRARQVPTTGSPMTQASGWTLLCQDGRMQSPRRAGKVPERHEQG